MNAWNIGLMKHQLNYFQQEYLLTENITTDNCGRTKHVLHCQMDCFYFKQTTKTYTAQVMLLNSKQNIKQFPHAMTVLDLLSNIAIKRYYTTLQFPSQLQALTPRGSL